MIIWIASYPRSGNTLVRTILHRSFGVESHSLYDQIENEAMVPVTGHVSLPAPREEFVKMARAGAQQVHECGHRARGRFGRQMQIARDDEGAHGGSSRRESIRA